jgi:SAM-dependent methyltransferase
MASPNPTRDQADYDFLLQNAEAAKLLNEEYLMHLDQPVSLWNYIKMANRIASQLKQGCHVLDWGCGIGQMTYLLRQRGMQVTAYDVSISDHRRPDLPLTRKVEIITSPESTALPFEDAAFDAVLSCGVLEHVDEGSQPGNEMKSLREIHRVLRANGTLLIYQLPQVHGWQEAMIRRFKLGYSHPRRYTPDEITRMLNETGFRVTWLQRANMIPKKLSGMPTSVRDAYSKASKPLLAIDGALGNLPGLRTFAGVIELTAVKR